MLPAAVLADGDGGALLALGDGAGLRMGRCTPTMAKAGEIVAFAHKLRAANAGASRAEEAAPKRLASRLASTLEPHEPLASEQLEENATSAAGAEPAAYAAATAEQFGAFVAWRRRDACVPLAAHA